jgi:hypothetical protein
MLVVNFGCSPHFEQRGEVSFCRSCFSMRHRMPRRPRWQVKKKGCHRYWWLPRFIDVIVAGVGWVPQGVWVDAVVNMALLQRDLGITSTTFSTLTRL